MAFQWKFSSNVINKLHHGDGNVRPEPPVGGSVLLSASVGGSFGRRLANRLVSKGVIIKSQTSSTETGMMYATIHHHAHHNTTLHP